MASYSLVVSGEVHEGFDKEHVKSVFRTLTGLPEARTDELFDTGKFLRQHNLSEEQAQRKRDALAQRGIVCYLEKETAGSVVADDHTVAPVVPGISSHDDTLTDPPSMYARDDAKAGEETVHADVGGMAVEQQGEGERLPFIFAGRAGEFFRIWIVNLLLTIVTLGFYYPWAKVRSNRYFYASTCLKGDSFSYLAEPLAILKGYLVALLLIGLYVFANIFNSLASGVVILLLFALLPLLLVRALRFRARNTAYRNIRFSFTGGVGDAYAAFLLWPLLTIVSFGILIPLMIYKQKAYLFNGFRYGESTFRFDTSAGPFWRLYLMLFAMFIGAGVLISALTMVLSLGGSDLQSLPMVAMVLPMILLPLVYLGLYAFLFVRQTNLVYNAVALEQHRLQSDYALGSWLGLQIGNLLGVVLSLGLLIPWAKIRTARYRAQHTHFLAAGDLDRFVAAEEKKRSALGEEIGSAFDMDIAI
ncbi:MAG TPA: DUF898 domain-containing protein [Gammaproteobacteria bacterium]|nr:DUF898 domain-containing protein [Gammaproteobacteria bacterium]